METPKRPSLRRRGDGWRRRVVGVMPEKESNRKEGNMMENYICINGKKTALTDEQLKELGFYVDSPLTDLVKEVRAGEKPFTPGKVLEDFGLKFKILGYDHDVGAENPDAPTVTLMCLKAPEHRMHGGSCPGGWEDSELRKWLNLDFAKTLPTGLQELIRPTVRPSTDSQGRIHTTTDRLFLPTESELFGSAIYSACESGLRYPIFSTSKDRIVTDEDGGRDCWWTSSAYAGNTTSFVLVNNAGYVYYYNASNALRAPFCFRIS